MRTAVPLVAASMSAGRRFIGGVPTNPATKRFAGRS